MTSNFTVLTVYRRWFLEVFTLLTAQSFVVDRSVSLFCDILCERYVTVQLFP